MGVVSLCIRLPSKDHPDPAIIQQNLILIYLVWNQWLCLNGTKLIKKYMYVRWGRKHSLDELLGNVKGIYNGAAVLLKRFLENVRWKHQQNGCLTECGDLLWSVEKFTRKWQSAKSKWIEAYYRNKYLTINSRIKQHKKVHKWNYYEERA